MRGDAGLVAIGRLRGTAAGVSSRGLGVCCFALLCFFLSFKERCVLGGFVWEENPKNCNSFSSRYYIYIHVCVCNRSFISHENNDVWFYRT